VTAFAVHEIHAAAIGGHIVLRSEVSRADRRDIEGRVDAECQAVG
jgi:hypothetical protein